MKKPHLIEFYRDCLYIMSADLLSTSPDEGCALLIGDKEKLISPNSTWKFCIRFIWPCCNIWSNQKINLNDWNNSFVEQVCKKGSKRNRFLLDPREQIYAQKWARQKNWEVLGTAHSHPHGESKPSDSDLDMVSSEGLMIIVNGAQSIRAWWLSNDPLTPPQELKYIISDQYIEN